MSVIDSDPKSALILIVKVKSKNHYDRTFNQSNKTRDKNNMIHP